MTMEKQKKYPKFKSLRSFFLSVLPKKRMCDCGDGCCFQEWNECRQQFIDNVSIMYGIDLEN
jgi:hypothetical protein